MRPPASNNKSGRESFYSQKFAYHRIGQDQQFYISSVLGKRDKRASIEVDFIVWLCCLCLWPSVCLWFRSISWSTPKLALHLTIFWTFALVWVFLQVNKFPLLIKLRFKLNPTYMYIDSLPLIATKYPKWGCTMILLFEEHSSSGIWVNTKHFSTTNQQNLISVFTWNEEGVETFKKWRVGLVYHKQILKENAISI